jgi:fructose-1,6-bisphosphatase I/sedoheptulose-1,7-bisphosphatase/fructose-1,6-bisphosphatase I
MHNGRTTLSKFLIQQLKGSAELSDLAALLVDIAAAVKAISAMTAKGELGGVLGSLDTQNVQGETQKKLDVMSNTAFVNTFALGGLVAGLASEEMDDPVVIDAKDGSGRFLTVFDPLDGSSNIDVNVSVGSIFSVLRAPEGRPPVAADYLVAGRNQLAAGYAIYGPSTMLVLTVGKGTHGFTLDREVGNFILTHPDMQVPEDTSEFAINASNERFWEPPVQRYVTECKNGRTDVRARDFNMRWIASMVADIHRILMRGGVFMYPKDTKDPAKQGRLRLMYEANPMSMVIEQAGGIGSTGRVRLLDLQPEEIHQRVPVVIGSKNEVERIERYHQEYDNGSDEQYKSPLFQERSLYSNNN